MFCPLLPTVLSNHLYSFIPIYQFLHFPNFELIPFFDIPSWSYFILVIFQEEHIPFWAHSKKSSFQKELHSKTSKFHFDHIPFWTYSKEHISFWAHSKKCTFQKEQLPNWGHCILIFHFYNIPKRTQSIKSTIQIKQDPNKTTESSNNSL